MWVRVPPQVPNKNNLVQIRLGLLDRADGADNVSVHLFGLVGVGQVVLALKGHIVAVAAHEDQIIALHNHGVDDFLEKSVQQLIVRQLGSAQIHQQLVLGAVRHLGGLEGDIDQILADGAGKHPLEEGKILVPLVLGHDTGALAEFRDDLLIVIDKAAVDFRNIAAIPPQMAADLADFLVVHGLTSLLYEMPGHYSTGVRKNPVQKGSYAIRRMFTSIRTH